MEVIKKFTEDSRRRSRGATIASGLLLLGSLLATIPSWSVGTKQPEVLFCYAPRKAECASSPQRRGIAWIINNERRNYLFDTNVKVLRESPAEVSHLPIYNLIAISLSSLSYIISKGTTRRNERAIHSEFALVRAEALCNDILTDSHTDIMRFQADQMGAIAKAGIQRSTTESIEGMKSPDEVFYEQLAGRTQGEISTKSHDLEVLEVEKQILEAKLAIAAASKKLQKMSGDSSGASSPDEESNAVLKEHLIELLQNHEGGYLWDIIKSLKPLWLIGNQGSGKTYAAASIALIRKYCLDAPVKYLIDRHATGDNAEVWKFLQAEDKAESEGEISEAFDECCARWLQRIKERPASRQQVIVDEFTNLKTLCGDSAINFFKLSLSDTRKAKEYLLGITHNATNESFPEGTDGTRKSGTILLERFSANGETPLDRVVIRYGMVDEKGNNLKDAERTIPSWFHPEKIHGHFNGKPIEA